MKNFAGYIKLNEEGRSLNLNKPEYPLLIKTSSACVYSKKQEYSYKQYKIILLGSITDIYADKINFSFSDCTQEEIIGKLYEKYGDSFPEYLEGLFLIIIFNTKDKTIKIINNRYQADNFYYYFDGKHFAFADGLKNLLNFSNIKREIDLRSVKLFLSLGYSPSEKLLLKNTFRLLPSFIITYAGNEIVFKNYWHSVFKFKRNKFDNLDTHLEKYEKCFRNGIDKYLNANKTEKLGVLLSGGQDTSYLFIQSSKVFRKPIHTFTASFANWGFDEYPKAKYVAEKFGGISHQVVVSSDKLDVVPDLIRANEELVSGSTFPVYLCTQEASKYVDTMFTGDGGDPLWSEYFPVAEWHKYMKHLPYFFRKFFHASVRGAKKIIDWERLSELEHVVGLFSDKSFYDDFFLKLCTYRQFNKEFLNKLMPDSKNKEVNKCSLSLPFNKNNFSEALIEAKMFYGVSMYANLSNEKTFNSFDINYYSPYLNQALLRFITSLPENWVNYGSTFQKLSNKALKRRFHKLALGKYLSKEYIYNLQQSFDVPWHVLFLPRPKLLDNLLKRLKNRDWFDPAVLDNIFYDFKSKDYKKHELCELDSHGYRIYSLLSLEVWCMEFLDHNSSPKRGVTLEEYLAL